jgi:hypothetical protein
MLKQLGIVLAVVGLALGGLLFWAGFHQVGAPAPIRAAASSGPAPLPLDLVRGATAAYSLRKLRSGYLGKAVNVRRSSDNLTADIGFTPSGDFDIAAFNAYIGGGSGFVTKWYDQSGNGHDAVQATAANQPQITLATTSNGRPALTSASTTVEMDATVPATTLPLTLNAVVTRTGNFKNFNAFLAFGNAQPGIYYNNSAGGGIGVAILNSAALPTIVGADNQFHSATGMVNGASSRITVDRAQTLGSLPAPTGATSLDVFSSAGSGLIGSMCEAIYFPLALAAGDIATLGSNQQSYWGLP